LHFQIGPPLEVPVGEFRSELKDVLLESLETLEFPGLEVAVDVLVVDLVDGEFAEEGLGPVEGKCSVGLQDFPEAVGAQFGVFDDVLVVFVEDVVQDALRLDLQPQVLLPDLACRPLVGLVGLIEFGYDDQLFQGIVEMFLVVVEGRVQSLFNFLLLLYF
jgi:hypothetical protein